MRILHYSLGIPPYRSGGLTKYSFDLILEQSKKNYVSLLFPGKNTISKNMKIKKYKNKDNIMIYEIQNTLPVPLLGGIKDVDKYMQSKNQSKDIFKRFFEEINPDIIHIHTLMGLPKEFLDTAKQMNIKTVFTTHDYFGICPKVNLINFDGKLCSGKSVDCTKCNCDAYSMRMISLMQSGLYRSIKGKKFFENFKNRKKKQLQEKKSSFNGISRYSEYRNLRSFYMEMLNNISIIHYNSNISRNIYKQFCKTKGEVINITHKSIRDNRIEKQFNNKNLRILFIGPMEEYKGFKLVERSLERIKNKNWILNGYGNSYEVDCGNLNNKIEFHGRYKYEELKSIFEKNDILIVPSIWNETFGFIVLEALSYGVPVITTELVGANDLIVNNEDGFIVKESEEEISKLIEKLEENREILCKINKKICEKSYTFELKEHCRDIIELYNIVINNED